MSDEVQAVMVAERDTESNALPPVVNLSASALLAMMHKAEHGHLIEYVAGKPDVTAIDDQYISGFKQAEEYITGHRQIREWFLHIREDGLLSATTDGLAVPMLFASDEWMLENDLM